MLNILKAEYKKFFQGKLFIAIVILVLAFPLSTGLLYGLVFKRLNNDFFPINAQTAFIGSFSPLNNLGLIFLIFILIILMADFTQNTIRNKVIAGYSRNTVYLSSTIFTLSVSFVVIGVYTLLTYLIVGVFIGFGDGNFIIIIRHWAVSILATMSLYAFVQFAVYVFKSLGASLGVILGSLFGELLIYGILSFSMDDKVKRIVVIVVPLLQLTNMTPFHAQDIFWMMLSSVVITFAIIAFGLFLNKKLDFK